MSQSDDGQIILSETFSCWSGIRYSVSSSSFRFSAPSATLLVWMSSGTCFRTLELHSALPCRTKSHRDRCTLTTIRVKITHGQCHFLAPANPYRFAGSTIVHRNPTDVRYFFTISSLPLFLLLIGSITEEFYKIHFAWLWMIYI